MPMLTSTSPPVRTDQLWVLYGRAGRRAHERPARQRRTPMLGTTRYMYAMMSAESTISGGESTQLDGRLERKNPNIMGATTTPTTRVAVGGDAEGSNSTVARSSTDC